MTEINLAPGLSVASYDLAGMNAFLKTDEARGAGVVVSLSGVLEPGRTDCRIFAGQPIGQEIVNTLDGKLVRAAVVKMAPYFDARHARFFAAGLMRAVANARRLEAIDDRTLDALDYDEVPSGDILLVRAAMIGLARCIDEVLDYPLLGIKQPAVAAPQG